MIWMEKKSWTIFLEMYPWKITNDEMRPDAHAHTHSYIHAITKKNHYNSILNKKILKIISLCWKFQKFLAKKIWIYGLTTYRSFRLTFFSIKIFTWKACLLLSFVETCGLYHALNRNGRDFVGCVQSKARFRFDLIVWLCDVFRVRCVFVCRCSQ